MNHDNIDYDKIKAAGDALVEGDDSLMSTLTEDEVAWIFALDRYINGDKDDDTRR